MFMYTGLALVYGQLIRGISAWHRSLLVSSYLSCRPLLASTMHALLDFWIVAIPAGSASFMYRIQDNSPRFVPFNMCAVSW